MIIEYCAFKEGFKSFRDYAVLGDDVVIWNQRVASRYKRQMEKHGITINLQKSIVSTSYHQVEFAKRLFHSGVEITGLKFTILNQASKSIYMLVDLVRVMNLRGYFQTPGQFSLNHATSDKYRDMASVLLAETSL
jgi:hypothetical protein